MWIYTSNKRTLSAQPRNLRKTLLLITSPGRFSIIFPLSVLRSCCSTVPQICGRRVFLTLFPISLFPSFPLTSQVSWTLLSLRRRQHKMQQMKLMSLEQAVFHLYEWGQMEQQGVGNGRQGYQLPAGRSSAWEDRVAVNMSYKRNSGVAGEQTSWCSLAHQGSCSCKLWNQNFCVPSTIVCKQESTSDLFIGSNNTVEQLQ